MDRFRYKEVKSGIEKTDKKVEQFAKKYRKQERKTPEQPWGTYDSKEWSYDIAFSRVMPERHLQAGHFPEEGIISRYLRKKFENRAGDLVGIELGGPGSSLFEDLNKSSDKNLFVKSAGVTLMDFRSNDRRVIDNKNNHTVIATNIFEQKNKTNDGVGLVKKWLNGSKADFIIERMEGGIYDFPNNINYFYLILKQWYEMLEVGGVMFIQVPVNVKANVTPLIQEWCNLVNQNHSDSIFVQFSPIGGVNAALRIEKLKEGKLPR